VLTIVAIAVVTPVVTLMACLGTRRIQSRPLVRSLADARDGDMRGIALQTIIIMVVLLAIAGSVAAVLLSRAGEETERLETSDNRSVYGITTESGCLLGGYTWETANAAGADLIALQNARPGSVATDDFCKPS